MQQIQKQELKTSIPRERIKRVWSFPSLKVAQVASVICLMHRERARAEVVGMDINRLPIYMCPKCKIIIRA